MKEIYKIDFKSAAERLCPPARRTPKFLAWLNVLIHPVQWLRNLVFNSYADGFVNPSALYYREDESYSFGSLVIDKGDKVYLNVNAGGITSGVAPASDTGIWLKVLDDYIGVRQRLVTNSQIILFEALLNKRFRVIGNKRIYIITTDTAPEYIYFYNQFEKLQRRYIYTKFEGEEPLYLHIQNEYHIEHHYIIRVPVADIVQQNSFWVNSGKGEVDTDDVVRDRLLDKVEGEAHKYNLADKIFKVEAY